MAEREHNALNWNEGETWRQEREATDQRAPVKQNNELDRNGRATWKKSLEPTQQPKTREANEQTKWISPTSAPTGGTLRTNLPRAKTK